MWWLILCLNLTRPQYSDIWSNITLDVSVQVFLGKINIYTHE